MGEWPFLPLLPYSSSFYSAILVCFNTLYKHNPLLCSTQAFHFKRRWQRTRGWNKQAERDFSKLLINKVNKGLCNLPIAKTLQLSLGYKGSTWALDFYCFLYSATLMSLFNLFFLPKTKCCFM